MTKVHIILALALATGTAAAPLAIRSPGSAPPQDAVEAAIRATHRQMQDAAGRLDAAALYAHVLDTGTPPIAEDGILFGSHEAALASTRAGLSAVSRLSYRYAHESVKVISKDVALWVADGTTSVTLQDGREFAAPFAETIVFVLKHGEWKVLHAHRSAPNP